MKGSKILSVLTSLLTAVFLLTGGIAVPILWRGFYYWQMDALQLPYRSGFSAEVVKGAFDQVMDYLVKGAQFGTGLLKWSQEGQAHFADCKTLFWLDFAVLGVCAALLLLIALLAFTGKVRLHRFLGRGPCFWGTAGLAIVLAVVLVWAVADFNGLFTAFHTAFFPGKTNWVFDWRQDQIILILPEDFWARAAALVGVVALGGGAALSLLESAVHRYRAPNTVYQELTEMKKNPPKRLKKKGRREQ